jgi:hypothetical protein
MTYLDPVGLSRSLKLIPCVCFEEAIRRIKFEAKAGKELTVCHRSLSLLEDDELYPTLKIIWYIILLNIDTADPLKSQTYLQ